MNRYLITTADERSWKFDRPVLFLGEWCRLYDRKQVWGEMDATVADPYGLQIGQKMRDIAYIQALARQLLCEIADALNAFHNTSHNVRYWNIVLGHWLQRYVAVIFNRYFTMEQALKYHDVSGTTVFRLTDYSLATNDSLAFILACNDNVWNHILYAKVLNFLGYPKVEIDFVPLRDVKGFEQKTNSQAIQKISAKHFILSAANYVLPKFNKKRDAFIINSYLPLKDEIKLQLSLGQCPQLWRSPRLKNFDQLPEKRHEFVLNIESHAGFERFVRTQLSEMIPICYLEGYDQLVQQVECLPWPAEPRFIFTSNNFDTDEIFKVWAGSKTEGGIPYFTGQHGNNYGTHVYHGNSEWPERKSSDRFLTWGWNDEAKNTVPAFIFKTRTKNRRQFNGRGGLLLIANPLGHRLCSYDIHHEHKLYQEEQFRFFDSLPTYIQKQLTVRLHPDFMSFPWFDDKRWQDHSPHVRIEFGLANIRKLTAQSRLVVHSYDSTGILETLSLNIPTSCFWQGGLDQLLSSAKPYYELLRIAGILADTPEHAAELIALHWDNINEWWGSQNLQDARRTFCSQYAKIAQNPVKELKRLLTHNENRT